MTEISKQLVKDKTALVDYFGSRATECFQEVCHKYAATQVKKRAGAINREISTTGVNLLQATIQKARAEDWTKSDVLQAVLMLAYTNSLVMLEFRNDAWPYEYMAFSRRIGELWEPFCKLCFEYPLKTLSYFVPPLFADVQRQLEHEIQRYIDQLTITTQQKSELLKYYRKVWSLVTSGEIKLELDLHFRLGQKKYNVDFKSGFSSNEKGNTNCLLLVATIYKNLEDNHACVLLVRSQEDQNNHYFQTLKRSSVWEAHCGRDAYCKIQEFTGFDIQRWINDHVDWIADLNTRTLKHFRNNDLEQYLAW